MQEILKAKSLVTYLSKARHSPHHELLAGVVRIRQQNKIVVVQLTGQRAGKLVPPHNRPGFLDTHPAFSHLPMASMEEAKGIMSGKLETEKGVDCNGYHFEVHSEPGLVFFTRILINEVGASKELVPECELPETVKEALRLQTIQFPASAGEMFQPKESLH